MTAPSWDTVARMLTEADEPRSDAQRRDTSAASKASAESRARSAAERRADRFRRELHLLDEKYIAALAGVLWAECRMRGLNVPDLLEEDEEP